MNNLMSKIRNLDPSDIDFTITKSLFLSPAKRYFNKIRQEEAFITLVLNNLEKDKEILIRDNITLEIEINNLKDIIKKINSKYEEGNLLKKEIEEKINDFKIEGNDEKESFYLNNILEPLRKKLCDINQIVVVKQQSILALEIIRRNNKEIIRNIDKIENVTIESLKTAVMVANSIYKQKLVLNKINSFEKSTKNITQSTKDILKTNEFNLSFNEKPEEMLRDTFSNLFEELSKISSENNKSIPENQEKIIELKRKGESYE